MTKKSSEILNDNEELWQTSWNKSKSKWRHISDHLYWILIIGGLGSGKSNVLLELIKQQQTDIDKVYLNVKHPIKLKYQLIIKKREEVEIKNIKHPKAFLASSQTIDNFYGNLKDFNPTKKKCADSVSWYDSRYGS